jgi:simple sugar transport system ATP-binding protein
MSRQPPAASAQAHTSSAPSDPAPTPSASASAPLLEARAISKYFRSVNALQDVTLHVNAGEVTCVLGDNGAGKSTLLKILSGVHVPDQGELLWDGEKVEFSGPREAREHGIATVFQDLATVPLMSVWRNFFLGNEPTRGRGPLQRMDIKAAQTQGLAEGQPEVAEAAKELAAEAPTT